MSYEIFSSVIEGDYSQIVMEYAKAIETMLIDIIYYNGWFSSKKTLNSLKKMSINDIENSYVKNPKYSSNWSEEAINSLDIVRRVRNPGAHKCKIGKNEMLAVRNIVLGNGTNKKGLLYYLSTKMKKTGLPNRCFVSGK